ncbi:MAG: GNAT family N-acetyltransferase [Candidatus Aenigmatarchaeota archaeon]|nr:GNAT family N-acetyltransferase [Nanoarchaeota archaeon]
MESVFRQATEADKEGVANVLKQSYNISNIEEGVDAFLDELQKKYLFVVAELDGKIIGIASSVIHGLPKHGLAELDRIAVLPEFRGTGLSKPLFDFLLDETKKIYEKRNHKIRKFYLLTHKDNIRAHEFYKKMGFTYETSLKKHYYGNQDEFVFSMFF